MRTLPALQATLAGEHAAVWAYAVLGGRLASSENPVTADRLRSAYTTHRARRDHLRAVIAGLGETPVAAEAGYRLDAEDRDPAALLVAARQVESRCAAVYAQLVAATAGTQRGWAAHALRDAAVRELTLGGRASDFPGIPEL